MSVYIWTFISSQKNMTLLPRHHTTIIVRYVCINLPFPSGLQANAETTVPSQGGDRVHTFCHCDNRCRTTCAETIAHKLHQADTYPHNELKFMLYKTYHKKTKQESCAIAKMTTQCALYRPTWCPKIFMTP